MYAVGFVMDVAINLQCQNTNQIAHFKKLRYIVVD